MKMKKLNEYQSYKEAIRDFHWNMLWDMFDGTRII